jgi:hypothetical protein
MYSVATVDEFGTEWIGQYRRHMRWSVVVAATLLAGCAQITPTVTPTALPGPVAEGRPESPIVISDQQWDLCTDRRVKQYPPVLDDPAPTYYAGPWCQSDADGTRYMWLYAEPLFTGETPEDIRDYVNEDASLLVRGLRTTGYLPVRAGERSRDVFYEARRPGSPNLVSIAVLGEDVPPQDVAYSGDNPLRIVVEVRKAGPDDTPSPSPRSTTASPSP